VTERTAKLKLAVDIGSDPITGSVAVGGETPISFCGWIELVAAIEEVRHHGAAEGSLPAAAPAESALG
jgi:hypothetical protein